jgi:hypothetical protein
MFSKVFLPVRSFALGCGMFLSFGFPSASYSAQLECLPQGMAPTDVVSTTVVRTAGGEAVEKVTVRDKLSALKASCNRGRLVDGAGREIYFYRLTGCWGNPPADYELILARQRAELEKLKKQYTVVEMTCNPSGLPIP